MAIGRLTYTTMIHYFKVKEYRGEKMTINV